MLFRNRILAVAAALQIFGAPFAFAAQTSGGGNAGPLRADIGRHTVAFHWGLGPEPDAARFAPLRWRVLGYLLSVQEGGLSASDRGAQSGGMRRVYFSKDKTFESAEFDAGKAYSAALAEAGLYLNSDGVAVTRVKTLSMGPVLSFTVPADFRARPGFEVQGPPLVPLQALHDHPASYLGRVLAVAGSLEGARGAARAGRRVQPVAGSYSSVDRGLVQGGFELPVSGGGWRGTGDLRQVEFIGYFGPKPGKAKVAPGSPGSVDDYCFQDLAVPSASKP